MFTVFRYSFPPWCALWLLLLLLLLLSSLIYYTFILASNRMLAGQTGIPTNWLTFLPSLFVATKNWRLSTKMTDIDRPHYPPFSFVLFINVSPLSMFINITSMFTRSSVVFLESLNETINHILSSFILFLLHSYHFFLSLCHIEKLRTRYGRTNGPADGRTHRGEKWY